VTSQNMVSSDLSQAAVTPTPARVARIQKGDLERKAILAAAYRFLGRASGELSMQDLLVETGLSTRAFYRHFASKDELILSMFEAASARFFADLVKVVETAADPSHALEGFVRRHLAVAYDQRSARQAIVLSTPIVRHVEGYVQAELRARAARCELLASVLADGVSKGTFSAVVDPYSDARAVLGAIGALMDEKLAGIAVPTWEGSGRHITDLFLRAFGFHPNANPSK
jgi:AcrR family transcriptional regulator